MIKHSSRQATRDQTFCIRGLPQDNQPLKTRSIYEVRDRLDPTHQVLRVTVTGTVTDQASREAYASLSHFAATGGPYAMILDMSGVTGNQL